MGSKSVFLKKRTEGTERADKAAPERGRPEVLRRHADLGAVRDAGVGRRRRPARDRRQLRPVDGRDDPVRAPVPDAPLAPELLPAQRAAGAGPADAARRHRGAARRRGRRSSRRSPTGRTTSSGPRRRRCCSTRSTGSSSGRCGPSRTPDRTRWPTRSPCSPRTARRARPLAGGTDLIIRLRDGSIRPDGRRRRQGHPRARAAIHPRGRRPRRHRRPRRDDRHRDGPADPAPLPGARRGGAGRRLRADPQPRDARRQPVQRLAGRGHGAGAARLRRGRRRGRAARRAPDPARRVLRPLRASRRSRRASS